MSFQPLLTLDGTETIALYKQIGGNKFLTSQMIADLATGNTSTITDNLNGTYTHDDGTGDSSLIDTNANSNPFNNATLNVLTGTTVQEAIDEISTNFGGLNLRTETNDYTVIENDDVVLADGTNNTVTITLPNANIVFSKLVSPKKKTFTVKAINISNAIVVNTNGGNIDGSATYPINSINESITFIPDGSNWFIL
jgi:hypothetical protein